MTPKPDIRKVVEPEVQDLERRRRRREEALVEADLEDIRKNMEPDKSGKNGAPKPLFDPMTALMNAEYDFRELEKEQSPASSPGGEQDPRDNVDMVPKWLACLNSHNKQVSFCTGCCIYRNTAATPGNGVRGQCGFKDGIDSHPCFVPAAEATGNSDNLCFAHIRFFEADQACKHVCHFGRCGPGASYNYNYAQRNDGNNNNVASDHPPMLELDQSANTQV